MMLQFTDHFWGKSGGKSESIPGWKSDPGNIKVSKFVHHCIVYTMDNTENSCLYTKTGILPFLHLLQELKVKNLYKQDIHSFVD